MTKGVACIGWEGPCDLHGQFHGCAEPAPHGGREHRCACGATCKNSTARLVHERTVKCGTYAGYRKHRRNGEPTCQACKNAWAEAQRHAKAKKNEDAA